MADGSMQVRPSAADPKCEKHPNHSRRYKNLADRLLSNIRIVKRHYETECWELQIGWKDRKGYIKLSVWCAEKQKMVSRWAHRLAHELFNRVKIPDDMTLEHRCYNPSCIRPDHTIPMSRSMNSSLSNQRNPRKRKAK